METLRLSTLTEEECARQSWFALHGGGHALLYLGNRRWGYYGPLGALVIAEAELQAALDDPPAWRAMWAEPHITPDERARVAEAERAASAIAQRVRVAQIIEGCR